MDWYWPVLLFVLGLAAGLYRAGKRRLNRYGVAQLVDARLDLNDRISTLVWFREQRHDSPSGLETVEHQAEQLLRPEDAVRAVPVKMPRQAWASLALVVAAAGMLGVRYGVLHSLDLGAPIASIDLGAFQPEQKVQAAARKSAIQERYEQQLKELGINVDDLEREKGIQPIEANVPATAEEGTQTDPSAKQKGDTKQPSPEGTEGAEKGEQTQGDSKEATDSQAGDQDGQKGKPQQGQPKQPQNAKQSQPGNDNSLMNKMRDALANLLNKMKSQPQNEQQTASNQKQSEQQAGKQGQQGQQSSSKSQGEGQQGQQQQGDQDSDGQKSASDKSRAGDKNSDKPGSQDSKSGMGLSDGDKDIRDAEQLAAMGKISQIFGKRAQEITGEISVEVASGKQQLKTAWTERKALHSDTGAEVNRDEIPLAYQRYIQRYFEEVRKSPAAPKPAKAGS